MQNVQVVNGYFEATLNFGEDAFTGDTRWIGISVRPGDSTGDYTPLSPAQSVLAVPYALSLRPGAHISGSVTDSPYAVLHVWNTATSGSAYGVKGGVSSPSGRGVYGQALNGGTGVYAQSDSGTALRAVSSSGPAIYADGPIQSSKKSYLFIHGTFARDTGTPSGLTFYPYSQYVVIDASSTGEKSLTIPAQMPAMLYGQPVSISGLRVYYYMQDGTPHNTIKAIRLIRTTSSGGAEAVYSWTGSVYRSSYGYFTLTFDPIELSSQTGFIAVQIVVDFENTSTSFILGGVRLTLEHD
ncbi:MAG: hypothetical protein J7M05_05895 [Anaerolineae bacterium]|nr:hypothetical protein [Anaerolineae bacterium]